MPLHGEGISDATRDTTTYHSINLKEFYVSQGFCSRASELMLASWRGKTNSNYSSLDGLAGVNRGVEILFRSYRRCCKLFWLAHSHEGYQYQSLHEHLCISFGNITYSYS